MHDDEDAEPVLYDPAGHAAGTVVVAEEQKCPAGHVRHPATVAAGPGEYLPVPQLVHPDAPAALYCPLLQGKHGLSMPPAEYIPAGQLTHRLSHDEYAVPAAHETNASMVTHVPPRCHTWNVEDPLTPTATHIALAAVAPVPIAAKSASGTRSVTDVCTFAANACVEPAVQPLVGAVEVVETPEASDTVGRPVEKYAQ